MAISPGQRTVTASFDLYTRDDDATKELYQAARQQSPISVMFQLGVVEGQLMGVYLKSVVPEVPEFDDGENRLQWRFRARGRRGLWTMKLLWHSVKAKMAGGKAGGNGSYASEAVVESRVVAG